MVKLTSLLGTSNLVLSTVATWHRQSLVDFFGLMVWIFGPFCQQEVKVINKKRLTGANSPVRGHPRGSKVIPLNSWGRVSY